MAQCIFPLVQIVLLEIILLTTCSTYPYMVQPNYDLSEMVEYSNALPTKRAFDRLESNDFGFFKRSLAKRAFDRLDMADFGFRKKRAFDRIARAEFGFDGLRRKRAFDRLSIADFGLRKKRAFDRLSGADFGLLKRSVNLDPARDELIDDLATSIVWLRNSVPQSTMNLASMSADEQRI
ncbi:hypothetical protein KIN20_026172 [Parelaphostrongylus tenuis]|uniref:Uncharacterized protein n=1 Tax=Parelaphostrongylus tenuis TaxID=148309 RepID=A0AAD5N084_PARTN|nr:hypothetical protein KIN20_026172 [Parelaphostrongylus tenuis]